MAVLSPLEWHRRLNQLPGVQVTRTNFFHVWLSDICTENIAVDIALERGRDSAIAWCTRCNKSTTAANATEAAILNFIATHRCNRPENQ